MLPSSRKAEMNRTRSEGDYLRVAGGPKGDDGMPEATESVVGGLSCQNR
jgi:hypothetical protein